MQRVIRIFLVFVLLTFGSAVRAQTTTSCGVVDVEGPNEVEVGTALRLKVKVSGWQITKPEFKWFTSAGTITMGQGSDEVTIDTAGLGGSVLTATASLSNVPSG